MFYDHSHDTIREGGAIQAQNFLQHSGSVMIKNCSATSFRRRLSTLGR